MTEYGLYHLFVFLILLQFFKNPFWEVFFFFTTVKTIIYWCYAKNVIAVYEDIKGHKWILSEFLVLFSWIIPGCRSKIPGAQDRMNRREDPLLRQHRSRLLQLAEATNIKPGRGSGKRRGQRQSHGFGPRLVTKFINLS